MAQIKIEVTFNTNEETLDQALTALLSKASGAEVKPVSKKPGKAKADAPVSDEAKDPAPEANKADVVEEPAPETPAAEDAPGAPAPEEKPNTPEEKPVSKTDVRAVATALTKAGKRETLKAIFKKFGGEKLSDIKEADYPAMMRELVAANG